LSDPEALVRGDADERPHVLVDRVDDLTSGHGGGYASPRELWYATAVDGWREPVNLARSARVSSDVHRSRSIGDGPPAPLRIGVLILLGRKCNWRGGWRLYELVDLIVLAEDDAVLDGLDDRGVIVGPTVLGGGCCRIQPSLDPICCHNDVGCTAGRDVEDGVQGDTNDGSRPRVCHLVELISVDLPVGVDP